jgi:hypothetical protein
LEVAQTGDTEGHAAGRREGQSRATPRHDPLERHAGDAGLMENPVAHLSFPHALHQACQGSGRPHKRMRSARLGFLRPGWRWRRGSGGVGVGAQPPDREHPERMALSPLGILQRSWCSIQWDRGSMPTTPITMPGYRARVWVGGDAGGHWPSRHFSRPCRCA